MPKSRQANDVSVKGNSRSGQLVLFVKEIKIAGDESSKHLESFTQTLVQHKTAKDEPFSPIQIIQCVEVSLFKR